MSKLTKFRVIETPFFSEKAYELLAAVRGQLSDGKWENTPGYDKYWMNFNVVKKENGQVVFNINTSSFTYWCNTCLKNPFLAMDTSEFLRWYAHKLKAVIQDEARYENWPKGWWKRDNTTSKSIYLNYKLDITVADIYLAYDWLKGRINRSPASVCDEVIGKPLSEEAIAANAEVARLKKEALAKRDAAIKRIDEELKSKIDALKKEVDAAKHAVSLEYNETLQNVR